MSRSKRMHSIAQLRAGEIQEIERRLSGSDQELSLMEQQQAGLVSARDEYSARLEVGAATLMTGADVRTLLIFVQRIDEAVAELDQRLAQKREQHQELQQQWLKVRNQSRALHEIAERYHRQEYSATMQREQREQDDRPRRPLDD